MRDSWVSTKKATNVDCS